MMKDLEKTFIVAIGASAGGLKALKKFVSTITKDSQLIFIIVQHLAPDHESILEELLQKLSALPVRVAQDGIKMQQGIIYVTPSNCYLEVHGQEIRHVKIDPELGSRKAVDHLFKSLAQERKSQCAGIILTGTGSDGTLGLRSIRDRGGLTIVQDFEEAEFGGMPQSAIDAHVADKVFEIKKMLDYIERFASTHFDIDHVLDEDSNGHNGHRYIATLDNILSTHEHFSIKQYKNATILRRLKRRMSLCDCLIVKDYFNKIRKDDKERRHLINDILINVTNFFRDPDSFETLEHKALKPIIEKLAPKEKLRIWVCGCATGEEAYSLTILALDIMASLDKSNPIKIFATDIDDIAIKIARKAVYPESIRGDVPQKYLQKYFNKIEKTGHYVVKEHVRDMISFASQNIVQDPPFSKMHLISCRNLLIYLKKPTQQKIFSSFHFALNNDGVLFLGNSETVSTKPPLFKSINSKSKIFRRNTISSQANNSLDQIDLTKTSYSKISTKACIDNEEQTKLNRGEFYHRILAEQFLPPSVIIDINNDVVYHHGDWRRYFSLQSGEPSNNIIQLVQSSLKSRLRSAIFKVRKNKEIVRFTCPARKIRDHKISENINRNEFILIDVSPLIGQDSVDHDLVAINFLNKKIDDLKEPQTITNIDEDKARLELEEELLQAREELQNTIEELDSSSEEIKASHEEALSTNEELQSANEELEASAEELRSLNEELSTVNIELKDKVELLKISQNDVQNFFTSTNIPTIFLDPELKIKRYTPAAELLLRMSSQDQNRHISALGRDLVDDKLVRQCQKVLQDFQTVSSDVLALDGKWYTRRVGPYKTEDHKISGAVIVYQDITKIKKLSERNALRERQQAVIAKLSMLALSDADLKTIMSQTVRQVAYVLDVELCNILRYRPDKNDFLLQAGIGWNEGLVGKACIPAGQDSQAGYTLIEKDPVIVLELENEKRFTGSELLIQHHVYSSMSCTINHTNPPYGIIGVYTKDKRLFTDQDATFLTTISNLLSTAIIQKESSRIIYEQKERLRIALSTNNLGYFEYEIEQAISTWDPILYSLWGLKKGEIPTMDIFWNGVHPSDRKSVEEKIKEASSPNGEGYYHAIYRVINKINGEISWVEANGHTFFEHEKAVKIIGVIIDITSSMELELSLKDAVKRLEEANKSKNEFLSILGHELRNPLTAIQGAIEVSKMMGKINDELSQIMSKSVSTMSHLLDDLLDLNRIETKRFIHKPELINLTQSIKDAVSTSRYSLDKKKQKVVLDVEEDIIIKGDPIRLEQIISNLLSNSSKYSFPEDTFRLSARTNDFRVEIILEDNGVGISQEDLHKVFEPFYQVKDPTRAANGLGIGLALAKQLVELHGGEIRAHSDGLNKGSIFKITLPLVDQQENIVQEQIIDKQLINKPLRKLKILLIEDNRYIRKTMKILLISKGYTVKSSNTGDKGVTVAKTFQPDVMLVDIDLPGISGHDVAKIIRKYSQNVLLIALSGFGHEEMKQKSMSVGFDYHLAKPAKMANLINIFNKVGQVDWKA